MLIKFKICRGSYAQRNHHGKTLPTRNTVGTRADVCPHRRCKLGCDQNGKQENGLQINFLEGLIAVSLLDLRQS